MFYSSLIEYNFFVLKSDRRESLSDVYQQDARRISESSAGNWQGHSRTDGRKNSSSDEEEYEGVSAKEVKPKERQRKFSLDFLFSRKGKEGSAKETRRLSTAASSTEQKSGCKTVAVPDV